MSFKKIEIIYFWLMALLLLVLAWVGVFRVNDFKDYHRLLSSETVNNVSISLNHFINERKRLIQVFADQHAKLIEESVLSPDSDILKEKLERKIKQYFPTYFSFTVTDAEGIPYYTDFDDLIGDLCLSDIVKYAQKHENLPRVHPHHKAYHYDLLADVKIQGKKNIFFVSFNVDELSGFLKNAQTIGHHTILALPQFENIIEVTVDGARNKNFREDYRLTKNEMEYLIASQQVPGSLWSVYDFADNNLFSGFRDKTTLQTLFLFLLFTIIGGIFLLRVKKEEQKREQAEAVRDDFISTMSHELRTPLTSINGTLKILESGVLGEINPQMKSYVEMAASNVDRLGTLVDDILDIKKMESGKFQLHKSKNSLNEIIYHSLNDNEVYAMKHGATLNYSKPEHEYLVDADNDRVVQVMTNLLSNAIKYGKEKDDIKIYVEDEGNFVRVNVEDHGDGIPEEYHDALFDRFVQAHSRDTSIVKGTGLGLSIAKSIIEQHGGILDFESVIGKGTIFYFTLPVIEI